MSGNINEMSPTELIRRIKELTKRPSESGWESLGILFIASLIAFHAFAGMYAHWVKEDSAEGAFLMTIAILLAVLYSMNSSRFHG